MRLIPFLVLSLSLVSPGLLSGVAHADEVATGRALVAQKCTTCHGDAVYTQAGRSVTTLAALKARIPRCAKAAHADWTPAQIASVVAYLNATFYHFPTK
jgi:mono/diheme cytochrome c family protein